ncbi:30S ribosomal protein S20 [Chloroflexota bacterium]
MSVIKAAQVALKRRTRNRSIRSVVKSRIARAERLISSSEVESAREAVVAAISILDRAAKKGVIHPNNAARRKSHLAKKLNTLNASGGEQSLVE